MIQPLIFCSMIIVDVMSKTDAILQSVVKMLNDAMTGKSSTQETELIKSVMAKTESFHVLFDALINVFFVSKGERRSTLVETANFQKNQKQLFMKIIRLMVSYYGLEIHKDKTSLEEYPRYFVYAKGTFVEVPDKNEEEIGKALEMYCAGKTIYNPMIKRTYAEIVETSTNTQVYAEMCDKSVDEAGLEKSLQDKITRFNTLCKRFSLPYVFQHHVTVDDGWLIRFHRMRSDNITYMMKNMEYYRNDFENWFVKEDGIMIVMLLMTELNKALATEQSWKERRGVFMFIYITSYLMLGTLSSKEAYIFIHTLLHEPSMWNKEPKELVSLVQDTFGKGHPMYDRIPSMYERLVEDFAKSPSSGGATHKGRRYKVHTGQRGGRLVSGTNTYDVEFLNYRMNVSALFDAIRNGYYNLMGDYLSIVGTEVRYFESGEDNFEDNDPYDTPLHFAVRMKNLNSVQYLINVGANLNAVNSNLDTPLHIAAGNGDEDIFIRLLNNGANLNAENNHDPPQTPLDIAKEIKHKNIIRIIHQQQMRTAHAVQGGATHTIYKGRKYRIHTGQRGGKYILVGADKKKIYM